MNARNTIVLLLLVATGTILWWQEPSAPDVPSQPQQEQRRSPLKAAHGAPPFLSIEKASTLEPIVVNAALESRFKRNEAEWQGMIAERDDVWPCIEGACTKARACIEGQCLPCAADSECSESELCVLGSCVPESQVECQQKDDCADEDAFCVLSGYTSLDPRGNSDMRAYCLRPVGGSPDKAPREHQPLPQEEPARIASAGVPARPGDTPTERAAGLLDRVLREHETEPPAPAAEF